MTRALRVTLLLVLTAAVAFLAFPGSKPGLSAPDMPVRNMICHPGNTKRGPG